MRKNAEKVLQAFTENKAKNGQTISTDGQKLYSYKMLIAQWNEKEGLDVLAYENAPSATTRSHVRAVETFFSPRTIDSRF